MSILIHRTTNANVHLTGGSLLGRVAKVTLPVLASKMVDHTALGLYGMTEHAAGFEKMEATFEWNGHYPDVIRQISNPTGVLNLSVYMNIEVTNSDGAQPPVGAVCHLRGTFTNMNLGELAQMENITGVESRMAVRYMKYVFGGADIVEFDALTNKYIVNGVDLLADYNSNLGL